MLSVCELLVTIELSSLTHISCRQWYEGGPRTIWERAQLCHCHLERCICLWADSLESSPYTRESSKVRAKVRTSDIVHRSTLLCISPSWNLLGQSSRLPMPVSRTSTSSTSSVSCKHVQTSSSVFLRISALLTPLQRWFV